MQRIFIFFILICFTSCNYFDVKKTSSEAILQEELQTFNWNEVDVFPSFEACNTLEGEALKKTCFENTLIERIYSKLSSEEMVVTQDVTDTIIVNFQISERGELKILEAKIDSITKLEIPNFEALLQESLDSLPKIYPAIKRGQQVKTQFTLPIRIHMN